MARIFSIANQKGGVGKSTTAVTLAQYFASVGKKVLAIDLDSQGHFAKLLGFRANDGLMGVFVADLEIPHILIRARDNLDIISSSKRAESLPITLLTQYKDKANFALAATFGPFVEESGYDYVFIDTPPAPGVLQESAVVMSDYIIVPIIPHRLSLEGLSEMIATYARVCRMPELEKPPKFFGVLVTQFDRVRNITAETIADAGRMLKDPSKILPPIPADTNVVEASKYGKTIFEFAPRSPAAIGFENGKRAKNSLGRVGGYLHLAEIIQAIG